MGQLPGLPKRLASSFFRCRYRSRKASIAISCFVVGSVICQNVQPLVDGVSCSSLSSAGGEARKHLYRGSRKEPSTNGWTFWQMTDPTTKQEIAVDALRDRYLQRKKDEARRFGKPGS